MNKHSYIFTLICVDMHNTLSFFNYNNYNYLLHTLISILPDIDECSIGIDICFHKCTNTLGSFVCGCIDGFHLDNDGTNIYIYC